MAQALHESAEVTFSYTINDVLDDVLVSIIPTNVDDIGIIRQFSSHLPPRQQSRTGYEARSLSLTYARTYVLTVGRAHRLIVSTRAVGAPPSQQTLPRYFPSARLAK